MYIFVQVANDQECKQACVMKHIMSLVIGNDLIVNTTLNNETSIYMYMYVCLCKGSVLGMV